MEADQKLKAAKAAFNKSLDCGITFFDTAEVYGSPVKHEIIYRLIYLLYLWKNTVDDSFFTARLRC